MTGVVTRFAPSPTGLLHIGGARTALFNWLFARSQGGKFLLRIEDTDIARSTEEATAAIFEGLKWLGLDWDGEAVSQRSRQARHQEAAETMLERGSAYRCYATADEVDAAREAARNAGESTLFRSPWRDADPSTWPDAPYVVRLKAPREGQTKIADLVQGDVSWSNDTLDDLVLLRSDGTPTYMLAVVVDDHDMAVSHIIRGDDHLTNAARQVLIYQGLGWDIPEFAHIPLIHGPDGKKMSKRHGAVGIAEYRDAGYPARAMRNYLVRLGWSHGDDEYFTDDQAKAWFDLSNVGKSAARFDFKKLANLSGQHIRAMDNSELMAEFDDFAALHHGTSPFGEKRDQVFSALEELKQRSKTFEELWEMSYFIRKDIPLEPDEKAAAAIENVSNGMLSELTSLLQHASWAHDDLQDVFREYAEANEVGMGKVLQPLRAILTGRGSSPGAINVMEILGRQETLARLQHALKRAPE